MESRVGEDQQTGSSSRDPNPAVRLAFHARVCTGRDRIDTTALAKGERGPAPRIRHSAQLRKSSTAARYTLSANSRCEQMKANGLVPDLQPKGSQKATSVHRMQHTVAKHVRSVLQFSERNTGLQNTTGSSWPHLRTTVRSIRQSAVSGRASSSFTSVGGNTT